MCDGKAKEARGRISVAERCIKKKANTPRLQVGEPNIILRSKVSEKPFLELNSIFTPKNPYLDLSGELFWCCGSI